MGQAEVQIAAERCRSKEIPGTGVISFTDSTLRDGEQCKVEEISTAKRIEVFDRIVSAGIDVIEVGHGGNPTDWDLVQALVAHTRKDPEKYADIKVQILFGSQPDIIESRAGELAELLTDDEKKQFIFHIYDREDETLRSLAAESYGREESADRVARGVLIARGRGFSNFSISGEGATGSTPEQAASFYNRAVAQIFKDDPEEINYFNVNLANTYGKTLGQDTAWDGEGFRDFTQSVRKAAQAAGRKQPVSLSIHSHNDYGTALSSSVLALDAGFDRVEGTMFGMGERLGNVALCDAMLSLTERARESAQNNTAFFAGRAVCAKLVEKADQWYGACQGIAQLYSFKTKKGHNDFYKTNRELEKSGSSFRLMTEAFRRLWSTAFGNPAAFEAGSGPHDHGTKGHLEKPTVTPGWDQYLYSSIARAIMGDPKAKRVIEFDPKLAEEITIGKHTGGGATSKIQNSDLHTASEEDYKIAREIANKLQEAIRTRMLQAA